MTCEYDQALIAIAGRVGQADGLAAGIASACLLGGGPYSQIIGCLSNLPESTKTLVIKFLGLKVLTLNSSSTDGF